MPAIPTLIQGGILAIGLAAFAFFVWRILAIVKDEQQTADDQKARADKNNSMLSTSIETQIQQNAAEKAGKEAANAAGVDPTDFL